VKHCPRSTISEKYWRWSEACCKVPIAMSITPHRTRSERASPHPNAAHLTSHAGPGGVSPTASKNAAKKGGAPGDGDGDDDHEIRVIDLSAESDDLNIPCTD
jgi:hypothetical protein